MRRKRSSEYLLVTYLVKFEHVCLIPGPINEADIDRINDDLANMEADYMNSQNI